MNTCTQPGAPLAEGTLCLGRGVYPGDLLVMTWGGGSVETGASTSAPAPAQEASAGSLHHMVPLGPRWPEAPPTGDRADF